MLHESLKDARPAAGGINLYERIAEIKRAARGWLANLGKNGYEHSERLEEYLDDLTAKPLAEGKLSSGEVFVLLAAAYLHDIGYWHEGRLEVAGHPDRSRGRIVSSPDQCLLGDFPRMGVRCLAAEAISWVCYGHSEEQFCPLQTIPNSFADVALSSDPLNLRKLAALLRLADEADDPYVRLVDGSFHEIRSHTPLVQISEEAIAWHWKSAGEDMLQAFLRHLREKQLLLVSSIEYLRQIGFGYRYLVLYPQVAGSSPFMAEAPVETFVGREEDLEKLHETVQRRKEGAITGVVGTGGIGKTELARMYAQRYRNDYPGGVFWVSLKGSTWKDEAPRILSELRPGTEPAVFPDEGVAKDEVKKALGRQGALLIIDNVTEGDQIIKPRCSVLVTTRERHAFGTMPHEGLCELRQLPTEKGVELLREVLGAERVAADPQAAARIVEVLGGMPLAVEIAARHLADMEDARLIDHIGWVQNRADRLKLQGNPDADVAASLETSLEQLGKAPDGEQLLAMFEGVAVCAASGFSARTLGAAAGLKAEDDMALSQLAGKLRSRSLLEFGTETKRYSTHPLLRQLAEARLHQDGNREREYRENHCLYWLDYAQAHSTDPAALITEGDGLWQAMVQANQLGQTKGLLPQFIQLISQTYRGLMHKEEFRPAFLFLVSANLINVDQLGAVQALVDLIIPLLEQCASLEEPFQGWLLNSLGVAYDRLGDGRKAGRLHEQALQLRQRIGDVRGEAESLNNMGLAYAKLGHYRKAVGFYNKSLEIWQDIGDSQGEGASLANMGVAYKNLGEYRTAVDLYKQRIEIARRIGDKQGEGVALGNMGSAYGLSGEWREAISIYERRVELARHIGDVRGEGAALGNMGGAYRMLGESEKALSLYRESLEAHRRIGDAWGEAASLCNLASTYSELENHEKAVLFYSDALKLEQRIGDAWGEMASLIYLNREYAKLGQKAKSRKCLKAARAAFDRLCLTHTRQEIEDLMKAVGPKKDAGPCGA